MGEKILRVFSLSRADALKIEPGYYERRGSQAWVFDPDRYGFFSDFGHAEPEFEATEVEITDDETGVVRTETRINFDRVIYYEEAAAVEPPGTFNIPTYTVAPNGTAYLLVVHQRRSFVRNLDGSRANPAMEFAQAGAMFFRDKASRALAKWENGDDTARIQVGMELGIGRIKALRLLSHHFPSNTFVGSATLIGEAEIAWEDARQDADREAEIRVVEHPAGDKKEYISNAELVTPAEYLRRVGQGYHNGVCYLASVPNSFVMIWLAHHPEFWDQLT